MCVTHAYKVIVFKAECLDMCTREHAHTHNIR